MLCSFSNFWLKKTSYDFYPLLYLLHVAYPYFQQLKKENLKMLQNLNKIAEGVVKYRKANKKTVEKNA